MLPKKTPNQPLKGQPKDQTIGTGLSSTLLSSQRTTTHQKPDPQQEGPVLGATALTYPVDFVGARSKILPTSPKFVPRSEPAAKRVDRRSGLADRPTIVEAISPPGSCRLSYSTRSTSLAQTRLSRFVAASPGASTSIALASATRGSTVGSSLSCPSVRVSPVQGESYVRLPGGCKSTGVPIRPLR